MSPQEVCSQGGCIDGIDIADQLSIKYDPWKFGVEVQVYRYALMVMSGVFSWEFIITLPQEIFRWKQLLRREQVLVNGFILLSRWSAVASTISAMGGTFGATVHPCDTNLSLVMRLVAVNSISATILKSARIVALFNRQGAVQRLAVLLIFIHVSAWLKSLSGSSTAYSAHIFQQADNTICGLNPTPWHRATGWAASMVIDVVIFILSLLRIRRLEIHATLFPENDAISKTQHTLAWFSFLLPFIGHTACFCASIFSDKLIVTYMSAALVTVLDTIVAARVELPSIACTAGSPMLLVAKHHQQTKGLASDVNKGGLNALCPSIEAMAPVQRCSTHATLKQ